MYRRAVPLEKVLTERCCDYKSGCDEYKFSIQTNIWIYLYPKNNTNEYPNIFVSRTNIRIYLYHKRISEYIRITNEYPNIFVSKKWYKRISEYICIKKMILIWYKWIFVSENIWIYEYICINFFMLGFRFDVGQRHLEAVYQWTTMENNGQQWITMDNNGHKWTTMDNKWQ